MLMPSAFGKLASGTILYSLFFSPSHLVWRVGEMLMPPQIGPLIFPWGEVRFPKFLFLPNWFAKLWGGNFSYFAKIRWMPS
jgi:hypothetical protein